uniref:4-hydroxy-tetrahydrodipicolinate reductase n=1 Tax=Chromera velia CCMP2878 TaxID=1169474 RepID=A0A0G4I8L1_9ALVE|mmetsp:Transcript_21581/g.42893  ORF Transcript_21581/g.42893 Transcript_21581/m.42893 type:complete len:285 (+) Transcript_21581:120-974(+)|eukprot:Cvel_1992.t1-p1 / transcript=Cvel_1992.t1 / gene=Cvel_1992 / organism=Chromera_velia_CCMP2878 / gene_product=4-hydroxy-tetrahydrodipicolinate reductase, putative / transcript_product=4-hydroxy-tetrahydrodipicolinate reductase, putative / location=Cvel_scaffold76:22667-23518(+) / protein_length=284 / sequence_SO=supercontig / SO=protein_coding / is_pseudo=false
MTDPAPKKGKVEMSPVKIAIAGARGRMGQRLSFLSLADPELEFVGAIEHAGHPMSGKKLVDIDPSYGAECTLTLLKSLKDLTVKPDVVIDFSMPVGTVERCKEAEELGICMVIGTTGLTAEQTQKVAETAKKTPVIHAMNYSLGVNLMFKVAGQVAKALKGFNIEIVEAHHNKKVDAPSGTAWGLADSICASLGKTRDDVVHGRNPENPGKRTETEIGMHAVRMGAVVGEHTVYYASDFERIELTHKAQDRDVFAAGALRAAKWLSGKKGSPAMYSMEDVLFGE